MATKDTRSAAQKREDEANAAKNKSGYEPGHTGAVLHPESDGRLKSSRENPDGPITRGTTEHSAQAPHVVKD